MMAVAGTMQRFDHAATKVAAGTPDDRERSVDFVRAGSIAAVVIGHWIAAVADYHDGRFGGGNALESVAALRPLTWLLQVMPLFFVVAGFSAASSWSGSLSASNWATWLHRRVLRIWRPAAVFVAVWMGLAAIGATLGMGDLVGDAGHLAMIQLWFLPVYLLCTALAPVLVRADQRWGWWPSGASLVLVATVELLGLGLGLPWVGSVNVVLVWLLFVQVGIRWRTGALRDGHGALLFVGGLAATVAMTTIGPYPTAMVGVPGAADSNVTPPSLALVSLGVTHTGLVLLSRRRLEAWLHRPRPWLVVVAVNRRAMTLYLWHLTAAVIAAIVLLPAGLPQPTPGSSAWWLLRPAWIAGCAIVLATLVGRFGPAEDRALPDGDVGIWPTGALTLLLVIGFLRLTLAGPAGNLLGVDPWAAGVLFTAWAAMNTAMLMRWPTIARARARSCPTNSPR